MNPSTSRIDRSLIAILIVIGLIVITAVVAVFVSKDRVATDPASPEYVVQQYSQAVLNLDRDAALDFVANGLQDTCDLNYEASTNDIRLTLVSSKVMGSRAIVKVKLNMDYGGGIYSGADVGTEDIFELVRQDGQWRINTAPWPLTICYNQGVGE